MANILLIFLLVLSACTEEKMNSNFADRGSSRTAKSEAAAEVWWHSTVTELASESPIIVVGDVTDIQSSFTTLDWIQSEIITSQITVQVSENWKGTAENQVSMVIPGGCIRDTCMPASHMPRFEIGERVLLFLHPAADRGEYLLHRGEMGKINLDGRYIQSDEETRVTEQEIKDLLLRSEERSGL